MKRYYSGILVTLVFLFPSMVLAEHIVIDSSDNVLEFHGRIVESTCSVDFANQDFTVTLDKISTNQLLQAGDETAPNDFTIYFGSCAPSIRNNMTVLFQGDEDPQNTQILAVRSQRNAARGLGLAIYDLQNNLIPINRPYQLHINNDYITKNTEKFVVRYKSTVRYVTPGKVNAEAKLLFIYQ